MTLLKRLRILGAIRQILAALHHQPPHLCVPRPCRPCLWWVGHSCPTRTDVIIARLIRDVGFDPLDGGPLRIARYAEPFALLVAQLAYEGSKGPRVAYRFNWFGK